MKERAIRLAGTLASPALGLVLALAAASFLLRVVGESPSVLFDALHSSLFTPFGLGYTLFYATPLIFTGLAVAIPFHCGLFNIGGEGQLYLGAVAVVALSMLLPDLPWAISVPLGILAAALAGGLWGGLAGYLKATRGTHEVIATILLNFLAQIASDYFILYPLDDPSNQAPDTLPVDAGMRIPKLDAASQAMGWDLFRSTPVNGSLFLAVAMAFACHWFLFRSVLGYELRAVGRNAMAARFAGIPVPGRIAVAMFLGGAMAGLVGVNEVMGYHHSLIQGFSPGYGFTGIAVALLARNNPFGILVTAFLLGALQNSARELEFLSERVSKELALVLQGGLIAVAAVDLLKGNFARRGARSRRQAHG